MTTIEAVQAKRSEANTLRQSAWSAFESALFTTARPLRNDADATTSGRLPLYETEDGRTRVECRFVDGR